MLNKIRKKKVIHEVNNSVTYAPPCICYESYVMISFFKKTFFL